jgi:hypothetical protein
MVAGGGPSHSGRVRGGRGHRWLGAWPVTMVEFDWTARGAALGDVEAVCTRNWIMVQRLIWATNSGGEGV